MVFDSISPLFMQEGETLTYTTITRTYDERGDAVESVSSGSKEFVIVTRPNTRIKNPIFADLNQHQIIVYCQSQIYEGDKITWKGEDYRLETVKIVDDDLWAALCTKERF